MWISIKEGVEPGDLQKSLQALGLWTSVLKGREGVGLVVEPHSKAVSAERILQVEGVRDVAVAASSHPRVDSQAGRPAVIAGVRFGGGEAVLLAGPCSVESEAQMHSSAAMVAACGATFLRGGAFKPRTSPYAFRGAGGDGLPWLREAADAHGLGVISEVLGERDVERVAEAADIMQVGSRNMQNFALLSAVGGMGKPVLLKRGMGARVDEWLLAGEHLLAAGSGPVIFCERGVRGFDPSTRNVLDLAAVALLKHVHQQIVIVDPSHATGRRDLIAPLSAAALAAGADGLLLEAHPAPSEARSDGAQALHDEELSAIARTMGLASRESISQSQRATG